jgi:hypothetical protein
MPSGRNSEKSTGERDGRLPPAWEGGGPGLREAVRSAGARARGDAADLLNRKLGPANRPHN